MDFKVGDYVFCESAHDVTDSILQVLSVSSNYPEVTARRIVKNTISSRLPTKYLRLATQDDFTMLKFWVEDLLKNVEDAEINFNLTSGNKIEYCEKLDTDESIDENK